MSFLLVPVWSLLVPVQDQGEQTASCQLLWIYRAWDSCRYGMEAWLWKGLFFCILTPKSCHALRIKGWQHSSHQLSCLQTKACPLNLSPHFQEITTFKISQLLILMTKTTVWHLICPIQRSSLNWSADSFQQGMVKSGLPCWVIVPSKIPEQFPFNPIPIPVRSQIFMYRCGYMSGHGWHPDCCLGFLVYDISFTSVTDKRV